VSRPVPCWSFEVICVSFSGEQVPDSTAVPACYPLPNE
jgi:hypothetical protein